MLSNPVACFPHSLAAEEIKRCVCDLNELRLVHLGEDRGVSLLSFHFVLIFHIAKSLSLLWDLLNWRGDLVQSSSFVLVEEELDLVLLIWNLVLHCWRRKFLFECRLLRFDVTLE